MSTAPLWGTIPYCQTKGAIPYCQTKDDGRRATSSINLYAEGGARGGLSSASDPWSPAITLS